MATDNKNKKKNTQKNATNTSKTSANVTKKSTTKSTKNEPTTKTKAPNQTKKPETKASAKKTPTKKVETNTNKKTETTSTKKSTTKNSNSTKKTTTKVKATTQKTNSVAKNKDAKTNAVVKKTEPKKVEEKSTPEVVKELHIEEETIIKQETKPVTKKEEKINDLRSILGAPMPLGSSLKDRKTRKKYYLIDALVFSIIIPVLDLLAMLFIEAYKPLLISNVDFVNYGATVLLDFVLIFIITYLIDFVFGEEAVKKSK